MRRHFETATAFLSHFAADDAFMPQTTAAAAGRGLNEMIFRGQSDASWPLRPSAHRSSQRLQPFLPESIDRFAGSDRTSHGLFRRVWAELRTVRHFLDTADKLGIPTAVDYQAFARCEASWMAMLVDDQHRQAALKRFPPEELLASFAIAQHHGVPTRLLDWTESPLVAAYFAAYGASSLQPDGERVRSANIGVFGMSSVHLDAHGLSLVTTPRHSNANLRVQRGLFVYAHDANNDFAERGEWPGLEAALGSADGRGDFLSLWTLPSSEADALLRLLWRFDITRHHLMPNLENAASAAAYARALFPLDVNEFFERLLQ